ncbi:MAG: hypothetical protein ACE5H5_07575 [Nitrospinota bacterium]
MAQRPLIVAFVAAAVLWPAPAHAERPAVCVLAFTDARPVKTPASVPYQVRAGDAPEPIRAHPREGTQAVRRVVLRALAAETTIEVVDLAEADPQRLVEDLRLARCAVFVSGAVFHYEGTVAVDLFGGKLYTGLVGYELVAVEPGRAQLLEPPVAFAGRRQSEVVKADEDFGTNDRQALQEWIDEAVRIASASLAARFVRPAAQAARRAAPAPK